MKKLGLASSVALVNVAFVLGWTWSATAHSQIATDGTVGAGAADLVGPDYLIPQSLGTLSGKNLFHSFSVFNVHGGESATFTTSTQNLANVISRVTGGDASTIQGHLTLEAEGTPAFFFINPAGVMFGEGAEINVPGAFRVTTGDYLVFSDGAVFNAGPGQASTLSSAPPEAFGFTASNEGQLSVRSSTLHGTAGQVLDLSARAIEVIDSELIIEDGILRLVASTQLLENSAIAVTTDATSDASGTAMVDVLADDLSMTNSFLQSINDGDGSGALVNVTVTDQLVVKSGSEIISATWGGGRAGDVNVSAGATTVDGGDAGYAAIGSVSQVGATGDAGNVTFTSDADLVILNGGFVGSNTWSDGNGGSVSVVADRLHIDGGGLVSGLSSDAIYGTGDAGTLEVSVAGLTEVLNGGEISSGTFAAGDAGGLIINTGSLLIDGGDNGFAFLGSQANFGSGGDAGYVDMHVVGAAEIVNGGVIQTSTFGDGDGGELHLSAGTLMVDGGDYGYAAIASESNGFGSGAAGRVSIDVSGLVEVRNQGEISSGTFASGDAGGVSIEAGSLLVDGGDTGFAVISSQANLGSSGHAGDVSVFVDGLTEIVNGGEVSSSTFGIGNAGSVDVSSGQLLIDGGEEQYATIVSIASSGSSGQAGDVNVEVGGDAQILNGGQLNSSSSGAGDAGSVRLDAGSLMVDGGVAGVAMIRSDTNFGASGNAGRVEVTVANDAVITNGGEIRSNTSSTGHAGSVDVNVGGGLLVVDGGYISSDTYSSGSAGSVTVQSRSLLVDGRNAGSFISYIGSEAEVGSTGAAGSVSVSVDEQMTVLARGYISSGTYGSGDAGTLTVEAGRLRVEGGEAGIAYIGSDAESGSSGDAGAVSVVVADTAEILSSGIVSSNTYSSGNAGSVQMDVGLMLVANGGRVSSDTHSGGNAGSVSVDAGELTVDGGDRERAIIGSRALEESAGDAGGVSVNVSGGLSVVNGGYITSDTFSVGDAGSVSVNTGNLLVDGRELQSAISYIGSDADIGSSGNAGSVTVSVAGEMSVLGRGYVSSGTYGAGNAGTVSIEAGELTVQGSDVGIAYIGSDAERGSLGDAGSVTVSVAGGISVLDGGYISSDTYGEGDAGSLSITAGSLTVEGGEAGIAYVGSDAETGSYGDAGEVFVTVDGAIRVLSTGQISSNTNSYGNAGSVSIDAGSLYMDGGESYAFIGSTAGYQSSGDAGSVDIKVEGSAFLTNAGRIRSGTYSVGDGGTVKLSVGEDLTLRGDYTDISAEAVEESLGQPGSIVIDVGRTFRAQDGAVVSIYNSANVVDPSDINATKIAISAADIYFDDALVSAESAGNIAASDIVIAYKNGFRLFSSEITTAANEGNGGAITLRGGDYVQLYDSAVTTSVYGVSGNGGDIAIESDAIVLDTGFIQANTVAEGASGGDVLIETDALVATGGSLIVGGDLQYPVIPGLFGYNVIQAAAPDGVSGDIDITAPQLDLSGSLVGVGAPLLDTGGLSRDPCMAGADSSLVQVGRGGLLLSSQGAMMVPDETRFGGCQP